MQRSMGIINLRNILLFFIFLNFFFIKNSSAQGTGALLMLKDNFHSNILNPSYARNDKDIIISVPVLAGFTVGNSGNFKISDLVVKDNSGKMVMDFDNFFRSSGNGKISLKNWFSIPLIYVSVPLDKGRFTVYLKENIQSALDFDLNVLEFYANGNVPINFKSFNSDKIKYTGLGYRELAFGFSEALNEKIDFGIRGKFLFGSLYANTHNWKYGIYTAENDESIRLESSGTGRLSVPVELGLDSNLGIRYANTENAITDYFGTLKNPGIGLDLGATVYLNEKSWMSASITDLGLIWFRNNAFKIEQNASYNYSGFDLTNAIDSKEGEDYIRPYNMNTEIRDSVRLVFRPRVDSAGFVQPLAPKLALHYQYKFNEVFSFGASNQTAIYKSTLLNIFTIGALQKKGGLSLFENISTYGFNSLAFGAGLQYEGQYGQVFAVVDNLFAVYHPAKNKSFSFSFGMSLLLHKLNDKRSKGEFDPYLPFYEKKN